MEKLNEKETWLRCKNCGHKLLKITRKGDTQIEMKCHSCKAINTIKIGKEITYGIRN